MLQNSELGENLTSIFLKISSELKKSIISCLGIGKNFGKISRFLLIFLIALATLVAVINHMDQGFGNAKVVLTKRLTLAI
jgi:hypothetical protein